MSVNAVPAKPARAAQKGQQTKAVIVDAALALAAQIGLEGLSIGAVAEITKMSKSGVFAHFGSREELQISVVREYHARFEQEVFFPAPRAPIAACRGCAPMFANWMKRTSTEIDSGCIYISGASEFDDRPGPGARCAGGVGQHLAGRRCCAPSCSRKTEGHPARRRRRAPGRVRDPRPDPRAALRGPLPAGARLHRPRQHRLRQHPRASAPRPTRRADHDRCRARACAALKTVR